MLNDLGGEIDRLSFGELDRDARRIAASLLVLAAPKDRALILHSSGLDFIRAFMGCQYANIVAVPASLPSRQGQYRKRVEHVIQDAGASMIITEEKLADEIRSWLADTPYSRLPVITTSESLGGDESSWRPHEASSENVCFIQYTSGSTAQPKGVIVRHRNILHNSQLIQAAMGYDENLIGGGWLPFFHDMGLIGLVLQPIFLGATAVLMSPTSFLKRPATWLKAISNYRLQSSGGPNFGFEYCLSRVNDRDLTGVDLSSWRLCFSGSEPVRQDTMDRFLARFGRYGLRPTAFYPCYGMAETTLFVSGGCPDERHRTLVVDADRLQDNQVEPATALSRRQHVVSCGTVSGFEVAIVHPATRRRLSPGRVGEVWLQGESVAAGYWGKPGLTREIFNAALQGEPGASWLRTGDLGFIDGGELFICGRLKDVIIVAGRNVYPQDIETRVPELDPRLQGGIVAAFGVDSGGSQAAALVCELSGRAPDATESEALAGLIRSAIAAEHGVAVARVVFAPKGSVSRTTSGKLQRRETQRQLESGQIAAFWDDQLHGLAKVA